MSVGSERSRRGLRPEAGVSRDAVRDCLLRTAQGLAGAWLLVQAALLDGTPTVVDVKDVLAGCVLVLVTAVAAVSARARSWEGRTCLAVGTALIVAAALLSFGSGAEAVAQQWSQVAVGVLLIGLWSARTG